MWQVEWGTDSCAPLEENGLVAGAFRVGEGADRIGRLVIVSSEDVVQAIVTNGLHEPLAIHQRLIRKDAFSAGARAEGALHVRAGQVTQRLEAKACVFHEHRAVDLFGG